MQAISALGVRQSQRAALHASAKDKPQHFPSAALVTGNGLHPDIDPHPKIILTNSISPRH